MRIRSIALIILASLLGSFAFGEPNSKLVTEEISTKAPYNVEVYSYLFCSTCKQAKSILASHNIKYDTYHIIFSGSTEEEMRKRTFGEQGAPRVFINDHYVGSLAALQKLDKKGVLEAIGKGEATQLTVRKPAG